ncbi:unnamed protein product [Polarella glacialis]|uniref:RING-type domain-containing protein n=1 Tax=Polarella glacialis TaxID=89957 RepID=A0A813KCZ9_POLGL|nr:unnamed protein product [Polarella glacialis]
MEPWMLVLSCIGIGLGVIATLAPFFLSLFRLDFVRFEPSVQPTLELRAMRSFTVAELAEFTFPEVGVLDELVCAICLDAVVPGDPARRLSCGHAFHSSCIGSWWKCRLQSSGGKASCPSCRRDLEVWSSAAFEQQQKQLHRQLSNVSTAASAPQDEEEVQRRLSNLSTAASSQQDTNNNNDSSNNEEDESIVWSERF